MRQYIGARYVPKFFNNSATNDPTWASGVAYESLIEVFWNGNTYISKKAVPASVGAPNLNPEYWANIGVSTVYTGMIDSEHIETGAVTTLKLGDGAVTTNKIADDAVTADKIADDAITADKIADGEVTRDKLASDVLSGLSNLWNGKHALIIGDSWAAGWNGSSTTTSWIPKFLADTGMSADTIALNGGGFCVKGSGTYTNVTYEESLENVKDNEYDCVVVQGGINDILSNAEINTAVSSFMTKCKTYFNCPVFFFFTVPLIFLKSDLNARAKQVLDSVTTSGFIVFAETYKISFSRNSFVGADFFHLNNTGYTYLGAAMACLMNGGSYSIPDVPTEYTGSTGYLPYFALSNVDTSTTPDLAFRWHGNDFNLYAVVRCTSTTTVGFIPLMSGLPLAPVNFANAGYAMDSTGKVYTLFQSGDTLQLQNSGSNLNGQMLYITCHYNTDSY